MKEGKKCVILFPRPKKKLAKTAKIKTKECHASSQLMLGYLNLVTFTRHWANQFDRPNNLTGHLLRTKPFTWNFELLSVYISERLRWYRVNRTPKRAYFQPVENSSAAV